MIIVLGASSQIGYFLLQRLSRAYLPALAISRRPAPSWGMFRDAIWLQQDLEDEPLRSDGHVLFSLGTLRHAAQAVAGMPRLRQVVAISSSSVITKRDSDEAAEQAVVAELESAEQALQTLCEQRQIALTLLRPTLVYGCGMDQNLSRVIAWLRRRSWMPIAAGATGLRQPVHADDIAQLCVQCLDLGPRASGCFALGGATQLTYRDMLRLTAKAANLKLRLIPLPMAVLAPILNLLKRMPSLQGLNGAMIQRQRVDLLVDDAPARLHLHWRPREFQPTIEHFTPP